jgi:hypothetical protein
VEYLKIIPPKAMTDPCIYPTYELSDVQSLVHAFSLVIEAFDACAAKIDAMEGYFTEQSHD